eukprot:7195614-Prymnesium_polylepis.1
MGAVDMGNEKACAAGDRVNGAVIIALTALKRGVERRVFDVRLEPSDAFRRLATQVATPARPAVAAIRGTHTTMLAGVDVQHLTVTAVRCAGQGHVRQCMRSPPR